MTDLDYKIIHPPFEQRAARSRHGLSTDSLLTYVPQEGEIVLQYSTSSDLMSAMIRYRSGSKWSHVDVVLPDGYLVGARAFRETTTDNLYTYAKGVQKRHANYHQFSHALRVKIKNKSCAADYYDWIEKQIGKPYDMSAIWGFTFNREWRSDDAWFCDEMILAGFEHIGFWTHSLSLPLWRIDPGGSLLVLSTDPSYLEIEGY